MAIQRRGPRGGLVSTKIPVNNLNSVATNAANKRQPNEADRIDNALVSLERGLEKRAGFEIVPQDTINLIDGTPGWDFTLDSTKYHFYNLPTGHDLFYYWYSINDDNTYLVIIDYDATGAADKLFYVFQLKPDGTWNELTPETQWATNIAAGNATVTAYAAANSISYAAAAALGVVNADSRAYITYGTPTKTAKESLKAVSLGANIVVLNTNVSAGFSSDTEGYLFNLDGSVSGNIDTAGQRVTYYTAAKVMKVYDAGDDAKPATADDILLGWRPAVHTGKCKIAGSAIDIHLSDTSSAFDDTYNWYAVTITSGTGAGQTRWIKDYTGSTKKADVYTNWSTAPDANSTFSVDLSVQNVQGTATAGAANSITLDGLASSTSSIYVDYVIQITSGTGAGQSRTISAYNGTTKLATVSTNWTTIPNTTSVYSIVIKQADYIPVDDYFYYNSTYAYLGQRVDDLSEIRLPPEKDDWYSNNSNLNTPDVKARDMLRLLYDEDTDFNNIIDGRGKIYYTLNPYLNTTSGYYRVISWNPTDQVFYYDSSKNIYTTSGAGRTAVTSQGRPYLQKIRTPDEHSYIDPRRMPQRIKVTIVDGGVTAWSVEKMKWTPRTSGTKDSNPGPSIFKTVDKKELRQVQIHSIAVFKDRLWFAADDVVFCSQMGEYENLFIDDPTNIVTTDPIDIRISSNTYAEISSMIPFEDYLFVDTKASTQFQLAPASGTELSPTNVNVSPVTYYSTATIAEPQLIGSRLYFFGPRRLYLFVGKNAMGYSSAVEVSASAANYLPTNYKDICTAPAQDTVAIVNADAPNELYLYTSRFSAEKVIQNSFFRFVLDTQTNNDVPTTDIQSIQSYKNYLYALVLANDKYMLMRVKMINEEINVPRLDSLLRLRLIPYNASTMPTNYNVRYDSATGITTFRVPPLNYPVGQNPPCRLVLDSTWGNQEFTVLAPLAKDGNPDYIEVEVNGDYQPTDNNHYIYFGNLFDMTVTLSTLFVRDENNNIIDGVLNIRTGIFRHFNTGNYDIQVTHRGRTPLVSKFAAPMVDFTAGEDTLPLETTDNQGEFVAKIYGYSDSTSISIVSSYPTPCNITNMEFKGKFKQKYTSIT